MQEIHYRYSEKELKEILDTLEIMVDTREQKNQHVLDYFRKRMFHSDLEKLIRPIIQR